MMDVQCTYVNNAPCDRNVVPSKKKSDAKIIRQENGLDTCCNFADEWLAVYNLMRSDDFIQSFGSLCNRVPNLILYNDRQVRDIKAMCFNRDIGSVLSFDKTFNLGAIYVTASVYKNVVLHRKCTGDPSTVSGADISSQSFRHDDLWVVFLTLCAFGYVRPASAHDGVWQGTIVLPRCRFCLLFAYSIQCLRSSLHLRLMALLTPPTLPSVTKVQRRWQILNYISE